jgi:hypothetical protein
MERAERAIRPKKVGRTLAAGSDTRQAGMGFYEVLEMSLVSKLKRGGWNLGNLRPRFPGASRGQPSGASRGQPLFLGASRGQPLGASRGQPLFFVFGRAGIHRTETNARSKSCSKSSGGRTHGRDFWPLYAHDSLIARSRQEDGNGESRGAPRSITEPTLTRTATPKGA